MKAYIGLKREGIPVVVSEEGWTLVDEMGVISFKRRKEKNGLLPATLTNPMHERVNWKGGM